MQHGPGPKLIAFSSLVNNKRHEFQWLVIGIFDGMALAHLDDTDISRMDFRSGTIIVNKNSRTF